MIKGKKWLAFAIMLVCFGAFHLIGQAADNIAYDKETYGSSQYTEDDSYAPKNVTNGNYNDIWSMGSVTLEGTLGGYQYVAVDLGGDYLIDSITAVTRRGLDQPDARTGWLIQAANNRNFSDAVTIGTVDTPGEYEQDYTFFSEYDTPFRYVRIASKQYIVVAEIEVYGELYDPVTMKVKSMACSLTAPLYVKARLLKSWPVRFLSVTAVRCTSKVCPKNSRKNTCRCSNILNFSSEQAMKSRPFLSIQTNSAIADFTWQNMRSAKSKQRMVYPFSFQGAP